MPHEMSVAVALPAQEVGSAHRAKWSHLTRADQSYTSEIICRYMSGAFSLCSSTRIPIQGM
jgi:hypothetical protein